MSFGSIPDIVCRAEFMRDIYGFSHISSIEAVIPPCKPPDAELVAAAAAAGVERILTIGMDERSNREAIASARKGG